jgi:hypothetical protein
VKPAVFGALGFAAALVLVTGDARAYRPFDGTDADVASPGEFEAEIQTVGYLRAGQTRDFIFGGVLNYGLLPRVELVLQGFDFAPESSPYGPNRIVDTGLFVKTVWKQGCLQQKDGPSFATEVGPLLPQLHDAKGWGGYAGGILSVCLGDALVVHWNVEAQILRQTYDLDVFGGAILEPPPLSLTLRPVAELYVDHDFGGVTTYSLLGGLIWRVADALSLDLAVREATVGGQSVTEVRAGFSLGIGP